MGGGQIRARRAGKSLINIMASKAAQARGERTVWITSDPRKTAAMLLQSGATVEIVWPDRVIPVWPADKLFREG